MFEQVQEPFLRYPSHSESYIRTSTRNLLAVAVVCRSKLSSQPSRSHLIFEQEHLFLSLLFPLEIKFFEREHLFLSLLFIVTL